jgi:cystathionine beta-lyase
MAGRPELAQILHPAIEGSPGHEHWKRICSRAAGLFSVIFDARFSDAQIDAFVDSLRLFKLGYSWAGPMSLVVPYSLGSLGRRLNSNRTLVRFSIGLEAAEDLIADIESSLGQAFGPGEGERDSPT